MAYTVVLMVCMYSDIISFITISVRGVSNKHCLLPFFQCIYPIDWLFLFLRDLRQLFAEGKFCFQSALSRM